MPKCKKLNVEVAVSVNLKEQYKKFVELVNEAKELHDLIPGHNSIEGDKHFERLINLAEDIVLIET